LYQTLTGLSYVVLRYSNVFGPRQNPYGEAGVNAIFIGMMMDGKVPTIYGDGEQLRDYVYVADVVDANIRALTNGAGDIVNIGSGTATSVNEIYRVLCEILKFERPALYAPAREGELQRIYLSNELAGRVLGWKPRVSFTEGLRMTVAWAKQRAATAV
jgi:UDP-glucose 4-epimerase